jgi:hypothetical protein
MPIYMNTLEFLYQETQIHFLVNPTDNNVMVNATEMAKMFGKRIDHFTKSEHAKAFIKVAERPPNGVRSNSNIVQNRGHMGIYFERKLALKFAAWLSPEFEYWVFTTLDEIMFGNYKKHWQAHVAQEDLKKELVKYKKQLLADPTPEVAFEYFSTEDKINR